MNYPFLRKDTFGLRTQETFVGNKCEIYIPTYYIDKNDPSPIARELGDMIETAAIFWFKVDDKDWYELQTPLRISFQFSERSKIKTRLRPNLPEEEYFVFTLHNGDAFSYNILYKKDADNIKNFISKMIEGAKLPKTISYNEVFSVFINAMNVFDGADLGLSAVSLELELSELFRTKNKLSEPFRLSYNPKNPYNYKMVRITKLPQLNSTFNSITGEDIQNQLVSSVLRKRENSVERESPIEKVIKY